ncbi:MAG: glycosyltransferase family 4 protein, partial [Bacteroidota bacterium]|nr:glycosyltransferase family 4 protein [Bacteroidota bacterium]
MKIAMIGQKGIPAVYGGVERHVEELSLRLVEKKMDVTVYTRPFYTDKNKRSYKGIDLASVPTINSKHFSAIVHTLLSTIDGLKKDIDIFHFHSVGPSLMCFLPRIFKPKAKVIVTF